MNRKSILCILALVCMLSSYAQTDIQPRSSVHFYVTPGHLRPGETLNIPPFFINNTGNIPAGSFKYGVYLSLDATITNADLLLASVTVQGLGANQSSLTASLAVTIPVTTGPGTYTVGVLMDIENAINESNENNNVLQATNNTVRIIEPVPVDLQPDIRPGQGIGVGSSHDVDFGDPELLTVAPNATIVFIYKIKNTGTQNSDPFEVRYWLSRDNVIDGTGDDIYLGATQSNGVPAGISALMRSYQYELPKEWRGNYTVGMIIDAGNRVIEAVGGQESNNVYQRPLYVNGNLPSDTTTIWRAQLYIETADVRNAKTDGRVFANVSKQVMTYFDYARNDFERGDRYMYDLLMDGLTTYGDLTSIQLGKIFDTSWAVKTISLYLNERVVFTKTFTSPVWVNDTQGPFISYSELRNHHLWRTTGLPFPIKITADYVSKLTQSIVGTMMKDGTIEHRIYWGCYHGEPVEIKRIDNNTIEVDLDLCLDKFGYDEDVDINFRIHYSCTCSEFSITTSDLTGSFELFGANIDFTDELNEHFVGVTQTVSLGEVECPLFDIQSNGDMVIQLDTRGERDLALTTTMAVTKIKPGSSFEVNYIVENKGHYSAGDYRVRTKLLMQHMGRVTETILDESAGEIVDNCENLTQMWTREFTLPKKLECNYISGKSSMIDRRLPSSDRIQYSIVCEIVSNQDANPANNRTKKAITVGLPDIGIEARVSEQARAGESIVCSLLVANRGIFPSAPGTLKLTLISDLDQRKYTLVSTNIASVRSGAIKTFAQQLVEIPISIPAGNYQLEISVLPDGQEPECTLVNNKRTFPFKVLFPDFVIEPD